MPEEGSVADNMQKGRGIVDKELFKTVGMDDQDRETSGHQLEDGPKRGRGRPPNPDQTWNQVGPDAENEQG